MSEEKWGIVYDGSSTWSLGPAEDPQCGDWHVSIFVRGEVEEEHWRQMYPRIVRVPELEREASALREALEVCVEALESNHRDFGKIHGWGIDIVNVHALLGRDMRTLAARGIDSTDAALSRARSLTTQGKAGEKES